MRTLTAPARGVLRQLRVVDGPVIAHFHASAALYKLWSKEGHLHFGLWEWPRAPWDRHGMLEALTHRVVRALYPLPGQRLADLGCGYGSSARLVAGTYGTSVDGFTVVPQQVEEGQAAADAERVNVTMHLRDFRNTGVPDANMDGVYALESLCYDNGPGKRKVLAEAARILKPGGRIALTDGFIMKQPKGFREQMVRMVEMGWAVPCFPQLNAFLRAMEDAGFRDVRITDLSYRVAPSALHGLPLLVWTKVRNLISGQRLDPLERAHLTSCMLGIALGIQHDLFRYLMITARKA